MEEERKSEGFAEVGGGDGDSDRGIGPDLLADMPVPGRVSLVQPHRVLGGGDEGFPEGAEDGSPALRSGDDGRK